MFGVFLFFLLSVPFFHHSSFPSSSSQDIAWNMGVVLRAGSTDPVTKGVDPPPLCSFFLLPVALYRETVVSSFHSACWCSKNSWLRRKETTSSSYLDIKVMRLVVFHFSTARDLQVCAGVPFVSSKAPIVRGLGPCFYTSRKPRAMGFLNSWPK